MKDQHTKITGYRDLSQAEIDLMNEIKAEGERLEALAYKVKQHIRQQYLAVYNESSTWEDEEAEIARLTKAGPDAWRERAQLNLQYGLMALTRAVAQPTSF